MREEIVNYCLNCKTKPCSQNGCPLNNDIPAFIHAQDSKEAYEILCKTTVLPAVCGKICPHTKQCQGSCIRGIKGEPVSIGEMEEYIGNESIKNDYKIPKEIEKELTGKKVAIIGGGPSGLTCGAFLAKKGITCTIYEKHNKLGGILTHGIPDFRLEKETVEKTIDKILELGIDVKYNQELGKNLKLEDVTNKYDAVFISIGANIPTKMNIPGEDLNGVFGGNTLLESNNHPDYKGKSVAIIGGGNVAMDAARTVNKMGANRTVVIYRRAEEQMPAEVKEIADAKEEGVEFLFLTNILNIQGKDNVEQIECIKTKLVQKEGDKRPSPVNIENSNYTMKIDYVIMATGSKPDEKTIINFQKNKWGNIEIDENKKTSIDKVYAGGDIAGDKATVAWAARAGRDAAESIIRDIK